MLFANVKESKCPPFGSFSMAPVYDPKIPQTLYVSPTTGLWHLGGIVVE